MKRILLPAVLLMALTSQAQYYYKDIIGTRESSALIQAYQKNRVSRVVLSSFNAANEKIDGFFVEQQFDPSQKVLNTVTRSGVTNESYLTTHIDEKGNVVLTVDSSSQVVSRTSYGYDASGQLSWVNSTSVDSAKHSMENEQHLWSWIRPGSPQRMLRIKNSRDTIFVDFRLDEQGRVIEETETRRGLRSEPVHYYYNELGQLTDIVRFSKRVNRLMPEYMFEYTDGGQLRQKITVPFNSSEYMIWVYQYNEQGLKTREAIFSKHDKRKALGKIVYEYSFQ